MRAAANLRRRPARRLSPEDAATLPHAVGNRAFTRLMREHAPRSLQRQAVIEVEVLTEHDSYADLSGSVSRVGDAHGPNVLMNIVDAPGGGVRFHWFNFKTGFAETGTPSEWAFLSMIDIAGTADSERFGRLGRSLTPSEWRSLWPNPVPEVLRR